MNVPILTRISRDQVWCQEGTLKETRKLRYIKTILRDQQRSSLVSKVFNRVPFGFQQSKSDTRIAPSNIRNVGTWDSVLYGHDLHLDGGWSKKSVWLPGKLGELGLMHQQGDPTPGPEQFDRAPGRPVGEYPKGIMLLQRSQTGSVCWHIHIGNWGHSSSDKRL